MTNDKAAFATLTLNPAIDRVMRFDSFTLGETNKAREVTVSYGGKGINVSRAFARLGISAPAYGFMGEGDSAFIENLRSQGVECRFTGTKAGARVNVKIISSGTSAMGAPGSVNTEANEAGGPVSEEELSRLLRALEKVSTTFPQDSKSFMIIGGSVPQGVDSDVYKTLIPMLKKQNIHTVCDASGKALAGAVENRPFMIKPNLDELSELCGAKISTIEQAVDEVFRIYVEYGVRVLCTASENGSIYAGPEGIYTAGCPQVETRGFAGAGDTFLAAFLYEYAFGGELSRAMAFAASAGAAKVEIAGTELPENYEAMSKYASSIKVERLR